MDKILEYTLREEDLASTAGGLVNLILKNCVKVTGHEISRAKFMKDGMTADGMPVHVSDRILPGQTLRIILPEDPEAEGRMIPVEHEIEVLYEDEDLIVVNKPAGIAVHPSPGHYADTMANYLAWYFEQRGRKTVCRIAGRLDRETSGTLVFAKNRASAARLARERQSGLFERTYLAIACGIFSEKKGTIDARVDSIPGVLMKRRITGDDSGLCAVTHYEVKEEFGSPDGGEMFSLVELHIDTGRTHQIRLHLSGIGHPLAGDQIYAEGEARELGDRALLHAAKVRIRQPFTGEELEISAPLPDDFRSFMQKARLV